MRNRVLVLALVVAGCGSVPADIDAPVGGPDAADAETVDTPPPRCNPAAQFGIPAPLTTLNTPSSDLTPWVSDDELTILFASNRPGGAGLLDIYIATRSSTSQQFGNVALVNGVNTTTSESRPVLSGDGLTMFAEHFNGNDWDVVSTTRSSTSASFGALSVVTALNDVGSDAAAYLIPDGSAVYFATGRSPGGLFTSTWQGAGWTTPVAVTGTNINTADNEDYPALTPDQLTLVYGSNRPGGAGMYDMYIATRTSLAQGFGQPQPLTELNTSGSEHAGTLTADGCVLYFGREVTGAGYDLFVAQRGQ